MRNVKTRKSKTNKRNKRKKRTAKGGKAVDAGSYGCVFIPPLKCADSKVPYDSNYISKLMYKNETKLELNEIAKVKAIITKIPDNNKYFIVENTYECTPDNITDEENLETFDSKCRLFTKRGITSRNVNENLKKLKLLNMPNGGINIEIYVTKLLDSPNKYSLFKKLNSALIELLKNGIIPINKLRFNHYDIKAGNILFSPEGQARLIDWGLSGSNDGITIPETIRDRSISFNTPFSDIFFNSYIKEWLPEEMRRIKASLKFRNKNEGQSELLKVIAINLINKSMEETSEGHFDLITTSILHNIYKIYAYDNKYSLLDFNVLSYSVLVDYIQAVLINYVDENGHFNDIKYFYDVFVQNVDIWGFIMTYMPIIEEGTGKMHKDIINGLCRIMLKYCFSPESAIKPINVNELTLDLLSLNDIAMSIQSVRLPSHKLMMTPAIKTLATNNAYA